MAERTVEKYGLDPKFERAVATLLAGSKTFWSRVGHEIDPEALDLEPARMVARAVRAVAADTGSGGCSTVLVLQRLRRWHTEGKVTHEQVVAVAEMFDAAEDAGLPDETSVATELVPVVRHRMQKDVVKKSIAAYSASDPEAWSDVMALAERATKVGELEHSDGLSLGEAAFDALAQRRLMTFLPTGIAELDAFLDGGIQRQRLGVIMADPGAGKSMFLNHVCAETILGGLSAAYASLELPESEEMARLVSNLTGMETRAVLDGQMSKAQSLIASMYSQLGRFDVRYFTPAITTVADIKEWVAVVEKRNGKPIDLLVVDPIDELVFAGAGARDSTYTTQGRATKELRNYVKTRNLFCWGASHVKAGDSRRKVLTLNDVSDSRWKVKTPDVVISAMLGDQGNEVSFNVAKNRGGRGHSIVGPLPTGFAYGMMVNAARGPKKEKDEPF
jgi:hypothetical protein